MRLSRLRDERGQTFTEVVMISGFITMVGLFVMRDEKGQDEKVLCVPLRDPAWSHVQELTDLLPTLLAEIEHFFAVYKDLEDEVTETDGFRDRDTALTIIQEARERAVAQT